MPLLLTMSLFGSIGTAGYIVLLPLARKYLSVRWRRYYLICNILEYLIPFPCLHVLYKEFLEGMCGGRIRYSSAGNTLFTEHSANIIQIAPGAIHVPDAGFYILTAFIVLAGVVMFCVWGQKYWRVKRFLRNCAQPVTDQEHNAIIREHYFTHKRKMQIYQCDVFDTPFVIGVFRPVIVLPSREWSAAELKMVMEHEIVHISQWDNLIKIFVFVIVVLNFYNPLAWYVLYQWDMVAELSCDRKVIAGKSKEEMKQYGLLMVKIAEDRVRNTNLPIIGFSMQKKMMRERIGQMKNGFKNEGVFRKLMGLGLMGLVLFSSSLSVLAYSPKSIRFSDEIYDAIYFSEADLMWGDLCGELPVNESGGWVFFSEETKAEQIVGELNVGEETHALCEHNYVSGRLTEHAKYSDNSCKVNYYNSQKCSKCGDIVLGELINTISWGKCPH